MAIIQFTPGDKLAAITMEAGWQNAVVKTCDSAPSKSGKGINHWVEFEMQTDPYQGKRIKTCFSTGVENGSVLSGMQFRPASDILVLKSAIDGVPLKDLALQFDTDELLMKNFDLQVLVDTSDGGLHNITGLFAPSGKGAGKTVPF